MKKSEYQNSKSEINSNNKSSKFKIISSFVLRISNFRQDGQALITLLFFILISLTITTGAIIIMISNSTTVSKFEEGTLAYYAAESGVENALLRLLRDPSYPGETFFIGSTKVEVTVMEVNPTKTVKSVGTNGNFKRTIQADMTYDNGLYNFSNWKEQEI